MLTKVRNILNFDTFFDRAALSKYSAIWEKIPLQWRFSVNAASSRISIQDHSGFQRIESLDSKLLDLQPAKRALDW